MTTTPSTRPLLTRMQSIPTSGARAVEAFDLDGMHLLAVPQLAYDLPGAPADMNGGDSDTELLLLRRVGGRYETFQTLPAPGGEDAEFFRIGSRAFLAVAALRTGRGPYRFAVRQVLHEWDGQRFVPFQSFDGFAAKQWRHLEINGRHFLALAQGVVAPGLEQENRRSVVHEWDGGAFQPFQEVASRWAYNWHAFDVDGQHFLAHADHLDPSVLYRWDGTSFVAHQELAERHGRAFASFTRDGHTYLLVARLQSDSQLLRWDGNRFVPHQRLGGPGAREFAVVEGRTGLHVVRVDFVLGTPADPTTALTSVVYRWQDGRLVVADTFPTTGATDVTVVPGDQGDDGPGDDGPGAVVAVSHSMTADVRFAAETVLYRFSG